MFMFHILLCNLDVNECQAAASPCYNGGTCYNSYGAFVCRCPPEWIGLTCQEGL